MELPIDDSILDDWMGEPKLKEIRESTMKYLISYYRKNDMEKRYKEYDTMDLALTSASMMLALGDYVVDSITTEYS